MKFPLHRLVRWLHVYLSMFGFVAILLFSITGLTLNHAEWFESAEPTTRTATGILSPNPVANEIEATDIDKLAVAEKLRELHRLGGYVHEFQIDQLGCTVIFTGPAYSADVTIDRRTGAYEVAEESRGTVALLDDLHKGRHSGPHWSVLIDAAAILTAVAAMTGIWLLFYVRRWRRSGLWLAVLGGLTLVLTFLVGVP